MSYQVRSKKSNLIIEINADNECAKTMLSFSSIGSAVHKGHSEINYILYIYIYI